MTQMGAPASSVPLVERTSVLFFLHLRCISIDGRSPRVLVLFKGYRVSQKKCIQTKTSDLSQISQIISGEKNLSCGEISDL